MTDQKIIEHIQSNSYSKALKKLYKSFPNVLAYVLKYGGKKSDAEDIFQDSMLVFVEKIKTKDFQLSSNLSTFLIGIAKNKTREYFRTKNKEFVTPEKVEIETENEIEKIIEKENRYKALDVILQELGKKCMELLTLFYHKNIDMKAIATKMGFKSETSAKTQKYKCIERAKKLTATVLVQIQNN